RQARHRALPHLGARDADDDAVVRADHHPGGHLGRAVGGADDLGTEGELEAEREPAAHGGAAHHEGAAVPWRDLTHGCPPLTRSPRPTGTAAPPAWNSRTG